MKQDTREEMEEGSVDGVKRMRRRLAALVGVLGVVQIVILIYVWGLLQPLPEATKGSALPRPSPEATTAVPATAAPGETEVLPETTEEPRVVGPLLPATDYVSLARAFDAEEALEHIAYLASDDLAGRQPGTEGGEAAGNYIAARFADYGLEPVGDGGSYFQTFTVPYGEVVGLPELTVTLSNGRQLLEDYDYRTDYRVLTGGYVGAGVGEGAVVWLNRCRHEDYAGLDVAGKIALCTYTRDPAVLRQAIEHQVGGLLLLDRESDFFRRGGYRETSWVPETIPAFIISEEVGEDLVTGSGYTLDDLSLRFSATPLSTTVRMSAEVVEADEVEARNVLALLPGTDEEHRDEVVVIGAHYDHLGREPDGAVMTGANDNASGVATVLEVARLWRSQGFRPARSVLFAAWDGEEQGLLGSSYYVENPTLPLTQTLAVLNLDMVGAGETLYVDAHSMSSMGGLGAVAEQVQATADFYEIAFSEDFSGGSDHVSFAQRGIPAANLIYWPDPAYHSPDDRVSAIDPAKLRDVGVLSVHAMAALADGEVVVQEAVERMEAAVATGDREAFLAGVHPADDALRRAQAAWFDGVWSQDLEKVTLRPRRILVSGNEALVSLDARYRWADFEGGVSTSYDVRFVNHDGAWTFGGYPLDALSGDLVTLSRFPGVEGESEAFLEAAEGTYSRLAADLGIMPITGTQVILYPDARTLQAIARPVPGEAAGWLMTSPERMELAVTQPLTPALANLLLTQLGLPPDEGLWLREGLAARYESDPGRNHLPVLAAAEVMTPLLDLTFTEGNQLASAQAWSAVDYLLERYGAAGLRDLCAAWGRHGDITLAFRETLDLTPGAFEEAWRDQRVTPLQTDAGGISATLEARERAVVARREGDFLATVASDPILWAEERAWFAALTDSESVSYTVTGRPVGWSPGPDEVIVALTVEMDQEIGGLENVRYDARFVRVGETWRYAGVAWEDLESEHLVLKYQGVDAEWAQGALALAEEGYDRIVADLGVAPTSRLEVKVYESETLFHALLPSGETPENKEARVWSEPGSSIKVWLSDDNAVAWQGDLVEALARRALRDRGVEAEWLLEGAGHFERARVLPLGYHRTAAAFAPLVQAGVRQGEILDLFDPPPLDYLPKEERDLFAAQSWSVVDFIAAEKGLSGLRRLVAEATRSGGLSRVQGENQTQQPDGDGAQLWEDIFQEALNVESEAFFAAWEEHVSQGGVPEDLNALVNEFDGEKALEHVEQLASPDFAGRQAGTQGGELAAGYIAAEFAALGLEPLEASQTITMTTPLNYFQSFPISHTHLIEVPELTLLSVDGEVLHDFGYRQEFLERGGSGKAEAPLIWINEDRLEGLYFGGSVILERNVESPLERAADLEEHGAGGFIVVTEKDADDFQAGSLLPTDGPTLEVGIPVVEITSEAFETLLDRLGLQLRDLTLAPPALPLAAQVHQMVLHSPVTTAVVSNVLGFVPGRDPRLADEILIVGAHYDHVGEATDGTLYPGANHNASGVAVLLEMARSWQEAGFRPARSVLFTAWSADEIDHAGVRYYLEHPAVPLTRTVGVISVDAVGNGRGFTLLFFGRHDPDLPLVYPLEAGTEVLERRARWRVAEGEGWYRLFGVREIPATQIIWEDAERDFYLPSDTVEAIDPERLTFSGRLLTLGASWLASR